MLTVPDAFFGVDVEAWRLVLLPRRRALRAGRLYLNPGLVTDVDAEVDKRFHAATLRTGIEILVG